MKKADLKHYVKELSETVGLQRRELETLRAQIRGEAPPPRGVVVTLRLEVAGDCSLKKIEEGIEKILDESLDGTFHTATNVVAREEA